MEDNTNIQEQTRMQIAEFLPSAIEKATISYRNYMAREEMDGEFSDRHKAAKVALAHIELLIKLAKWADLTGGNDKTLSDEKSLADLLTAAQQELNQHEQGDE